MMKTKKTMYCENGYAVRQTMSRIDGLHGKLKRIHDAWNTTTREYLGAVHPLTPGVIQSMFTDSVPDGNKIDDVLRSMLARERMDKYPEFSFEGLKRGLREPDVTGILSALELLEREDFNHIDCFDFSAPGGITPIVEMVESRLDAFREYAETTDEHERLRVAQNLRETMYSIMKQFTYITPSKCVIPMVLFANNGRLEISYHWVKYGRFNGAKLPGDFYFNVNEIISVGEPANV